MPNNKKQILVLKSYFFFWKSFLFFFVFFQFQNIKNKIWSIFIFFFVFMYYKSRVKVTVDAQQVKKKNNKFLFKNQKYKDSKNENFKKFILNGSKTFFFFKDWKIPRNYKTIEIDPGKFFSYYILNKKTIDNSEISWWKRWTIQLQYLELF